MSKGMVSLPPGNRSITAMKPTSKKHAVFAETLRRGRLAAARFALREAGALLRAAAPLAVHAGQKLAALSEHPALADPPTSSKPK